MNRTETIAKKFISQPNETYFRGFVIRRQISGGKAFRVATRGNYCITKSDYKRVLDAIKKL